MNYSKPLRWIHWSIAILVTCQLAIAVVLTQLRSLGYGQLILSLHRQLGLAILLLIAVRLCLPRATLPVEPGGIPEWQIRAARGVHRAFFLVLVAQPVLGIFLAWARGDAVGLFGVLSIQPPLEISDAMRERLMTAHEITAALLLTLCIVHIGAVLFNRTVRRVSVIERMMPEVSKDLMVNRVPMLIQLSLAFGLVILIAAGMGANAVITYRNLSKATQHFQESNVGVSVQLRSAQVVWKDLKNWTQVKRHDADMGHAHELIESAKSSMDDAYAHAVPSDIKQATEHVISTLSRLSASSGLPSDQELDTVDTALQDLVDSLTLNSLQLQSENDENAARGHDLIVVTMLPMLLVGLIAALMLSRSITSLLSRMRSLIRSIEENQRENSICVEGRGEFAVLVRDIASMREAIEARASEGALREAESAAQRTRAEQQLLRRDAEMERQQAVTRRVQREQLAGDFELQVADIVGTLVEMAQGLSVGASKMAASAGNSNRRSQDASKVAERTNGTASEIAAGSGELSITAREVRENAEESRSRARLAVEEATQVNAQIELLAGAVKQISSTTDMISAIARQTNLLAINARIEAARAGEVGRGFSIVADEVKVLANQTREATYGIDAQITQVQAAVSVSAESLQRLGKVIAGVDEAASAIFAATDAQFASTRQLVERIAEVSSATRSVVDDTKDAQLMADETERMSTEVLDAVAIIDEQAGLLREKISSFVLQLRDSSAQNSPMEKSQDLAEPEYRALAS